ncbi:hypothetical protein NKG94_16815 [Micromonospora sp. M12]
MEQLSYTYDELGRPDPAAGRGPGTLAAQWEYDTLKLGMPTSSTRYVGSNAYTTEVTGYNTRYQPEGTKYTIPPSEVRSPAHTASGPRTPRMSAYRRPTPTRPAVASPQRPSPTGTTAWTCPSA